MRAIPSNKLSLIHLCTACTFYIALLWTTILPSLNKFNKYYLEKSHLYYQIIVYIFMFHTCPWASMKIFILQSTRPLIPSSVTFTPYPAGIKYTLYCTVLYFTILYFTVLYCTVLYCIVMYCMFQWKIILIYSSSYFSYFP